MSGFDVKKDGGVWTFTIDRPERRNALTWPIREGLLGTLIEAERDGKVARRRSAPAATWRSSRPSFAPSTNIGLARPWPGCGPWARSRGG